MLTIEDIRRHCISNRDSNRKELESFFDHLHEKGGLYSRSLSTAVLYCEWMAGGKVVDVTYEVVFATPQEMIEHTRWLDAAYGNSKQWTTDILACFDHFTFPLDEDAYVDEVIVTLSTIGVISDWTSEPDFELMCKED